MYSSNRPRLQTIKENKHDELLSKDWQDFNFPPDFWSKDWGDFDHSQSVLLGRGKNCTTWIVHDRESKAAYVLQSCPGRNYSKQDTKKPWNEVWKLRVKLLDLAYRSNLFIKPHYVFSRKDRIFVCSENHAPGISLEDLIYGVIPMTEHQASAILKQVSGFLD